MTQVVTYQSPNGSKLAICERCEEKLRDKGEWPKDRNGQEYCSVSMGQHYGDCGVCAKAARNAAREEAKAIVARHPMGCSCGDPECPQLQCAYAGEDYYPDEWIESYVSSQCD